MKGNSFIILLSGTIVAKIFGIVYKIVLTNVLGAQGMGIYQLVIPLFIFVLTFICGGLSSVVCRCVSNEEFCPESLTKSLCFLFSTIGVVFTFLVCFFSLPLSLLLGNTDCRLSLICVAPSLCFCSISSTIRGYFQGKGKLFSTSVNTVLEQIIKSIIGLACAISLSSSALKSAGAMIGITASELANAVFWTTLYLIKTKRKSRFDFSIIKSVLSRVFANTFTVLLIPLSQFVDSILIVNLLSFHHDKAIATSFYGIYCGPVATIINLPSIVTGALCTSLLPLTSTMNDNQTKRSFSTYATPLALFCAIYSLCVFVFAPIVVSLLYPSLSSMANVCSTLMKISCTEVFFTALMRLESAYLQSRGMYFSTLVNLLLSLVIKTILTILLVPQFSIYGCALASVICYATVFALNFSSLQLKLCFSFPTKRFIKLAICVITFAFISYSIFSHFPTLLGAIIAFCISFAISIGCSIAFGLVKLSLPKIKPTIINNRKE